MSDTTIQTEANVDSTEHGQPDGFNDVPPGINPAWAKAKDAKAKPEPELSEKKTVEPEQKEQTEAQKKAEAALKTLKVKGREIEVDDAKYHEYAQKGAAATETWQEAARMKREAEEKLELLSKKDWKALKNLGYDLDDIAEELIWEKIQAEQQAERMKQMSPEERQYMEAMKKAEMYDQMQKSQQQQEEEKQAQEEQSRYEQVFDQKFTKALQNSGLPKTTGAVRRMIDYVQQDLSAGIERDPSEYAEAIYQDYIQDVSELFEPLDGAAILKFLGEKTAKKIRDYDLSRLKKTQQDSGYTFVPGKGMQKADSKPQRKLSGLDWERDVRRGFTG